MGQKLQEDFPMKKHWLITLTAVALTGLMLVGGTLAWFTDKDEATNVVTMGNIDISIWEDIPNTERVSWTAEWYGDKNANATGEWGVKYAGVLPGTYITKQPLIVNFGKNDAYLRANINVDITASDGTKLSADGIRFVSASKPNQYSINRGTVGDETAKDVYTLKNGETGFSLYYDGVFPAKGNFTSFTNVVFPGSWGNEYQNASIIITVTAEAIQSENLDVGDNTGAAAAQYAFTNHFTAA